MKHWKVPLMGVLLGICLIFQKLDAAVIHVPGDQPDISSAMTASMDGDLILVADGIYRGDRNRNLDFSGKQITIVSENGPEHCVIDCEYFGRAFIFQSNETCHSTIEGFSLIYGYTTQSGSFIHCDTSSPQIINCTLAYGHAGEKGGAVFGSNASPVFIRCTMYDNSSLDGGAGFFTDYSEPVFASCLFQNNSAMCSGGGVFCNESTNSEFFNCGFLNNTTSKFDGGALILFESSASLNNCTLMMNAADSEGHVAAVSTGSYLSLHNSIIWNNESPAFLEGIDSIVVVTYSDCQESRPEEGNFQIDPIVITGSEGDFYLSHLASGQVADSPCIGAGGDLASSVCIDLPDYRLCLNSMTTRTDSHPDEYQVDVGMHYKPALPLNLSGIIPENDICTKLLLHCDGVAGSQTIDDSSQSCHPITVAGDAYLSEIDPRFGKTSIVFDGIGDYLEVPFHSDWDLSLEDFTLDFWIQIQTGSVNQYVMSCRDDENGWNLLYRSDQGFNFEFWTQGVPVIVLRGGIIQDSQWHHVAVTRAGMIQRLFLDGDPIDSMNFAPDLNVSEVNLYIGCASAGTSCMTGHLDEVRISKGIARWTESFTPPIQPYERLTSLLLHANGPDGGNSFSDSSLDSNQVTAIGNVCTSGIDPVFGESSAHFDGTDDCLMIPDSESWTIGDSSFTLDFYIKISDPSAGQTICSHWDYYSASYNDKAWFLRFDPSEGLCFYYTVDGDGTLSLRFPWNPVASVWYHVALIRYGNFVKAFADGEQIGWTQNVAGATFFNSSTEFYIGCEHNSHSGNFMFFNGNIDEFRLSRGIARWIAEFEKPGCPFALEECQISCTPPTPEITATATAVPVTQTPEPSLTPVLTSTPQPTCSKTPGITPSPTPTPLPDALKIEILLNKQDPVYYAHDEFVLTVKLTTDQSIVSVVVVMLDVVGEYYFWPLWNQNPDSIGVAIDLEPGIWFFRSDGTPSLQVNPILQFIWPSGNYGDLDHLFFWAALLSPDCSKLLEPDTYDWVEFGYIS